MAPSTKPKEFMLIAVTKKLGIKPIALIPKFKRSNKINLIVVLIKEMSVIDSFTDTKPPIIMNFSIYIVSYIYIVPLSSFRNFFKGHSIYLNKRTI